MEVEIFRLRSCSEPFRLYLRKNKFWITFIASVGILVPLNIYIRHQITIFFFKWFSASAKFLIVASKLERNRSCREGKPWVWKSRLFSSNWYFQKVLTWLSELWFKNYIKPFFIGSYSSSVKFLLRSWCMKGSL